MKNFSKKYRQIVLADVQNPEHRHHQRWVWVLFGLLTIGILGAYLLVLHPNLFDHLAVAIRVDALARQVGDPFLSKTVLAYEHMIGLSLFSGVVLGFLLMALFAYDIQQRNRVIQELLDKQVSGE